MVRLSQVVIAYHLQDLKKLNKYLMYYRLKIFQYDLWFSDFPDIDNQEYKVKFIDYMQIKNNLRFCEFYIRSINGEH